MRVAVDDDIHGRAHGDELEIRILGPPEVLARGRPLRLGGSKQRTLLAVLALHANRVLPADDLIDALWDGAPPATAPSQLQAQVSALRAVLAGGGASRSLLTQPPGYMLRVEPGQLDLDSFERTCDTARHALADGRAAEAAVLFGAALARWRGPALGRLEARYVRAETARLEELRMAAIEGRIEAQLAAGRHADVVAELLGLVGAHPLRERLRALLMVALYRAGRQAQALDVYREGRRQLVHELGLEPGVELRGVEQAILTSDPVLAAPAPPPVARRPSQLPADIADFTGREAEVASICATLAAPERGAGAVSIAAITGQAGVGKSALAVHVGHELREEFRDGQLYANLRGAADEALDPSALLARFLRALGVQDESIPRSADERADLYRSVLASRRVLVVLDDAAAEWQVGPLLPGSAGCAVLVTSRTRLVGLEGARIVELDVLSAEHAVELLCRQAGRRRVESERGSAEAIVRACGCLPLAIRVAGARLAARAHWPLARLAARLADGRRRLDELTAGHLQVRASFALSYDRLEEDHRRVFRRLALFNSPVFTARAAAALLDVPLGRAEDAIETLVDAHLLTVAGPIVGGATRYRFHDLLRDFARERAVAEDGHRELSSGLARAFALAHTAAIAAS